MASPGLNRARARCDREASRNVAAGEVMIRRDGARRGHCARRDFMGIFHRPGTHPYVVHVYDRQTATLGGVVQVVESHAPVGAGHVRRRGDGELH